MRKGCGMCVVSAAKGWHSCRRHGGQSLVPGLCECCDSPADAGRILCSDCAGRMGELRRRATEEPNVRRVRLPPTGVPRPRLPSWKRWKVYKRDGGRCRYCGKQLARRGEWQVDHIRAYTRGGSDNLANLALACVPCNQRKAARTLKGFMGAKRRSRRQAGATRTREAASQASERRRAAREREREGHTRP